MARIVSEGFEPGDTLFWNVVFGTNTTSTPRSGSRAWQGNSGGDIHNLPSTYSEFYFRTAIRFSTVNALRTIVKFLSGTTNVIDVLQNADNTISVRCNNGGTVLATTTYTITSATYYLLEVYVKIGGAGVGVVTLKLDGIQRATNSASANNTNGSTIDRFGFYDDLAIYDDLAFNDTTTGNDNSWCGDGHIIALVPNGAGNSTQWTPSAGSNWQNVDEVPPNGDTDYNSTSSSNQRDDYAHAASGLSGVTISRVWVEMRSKIDVADGSTAGMYLRSGSTNYDDSNGLLAQTLSYSAYKSAEWLTDPDTSLAWGVSGLDSANPGIRT